jgi:hypothetical protein
MPDGVGVARVDVERDCISAMRDPEGFAVQLNAASALVSMAAQALQTRTVGGEDRLLNLECEDGGDLTSGLMDDRFDAVEVDEKEVLDS